LGAGAKIQNPFLKSLFRKLSFLFSVVAFLFPAFIFYRLESSFQFAVCKFGFSFVSVFFIGKSSGSFCRVAKTHFKVFKFYSGQRWF